MTADFTIVTVVHRTDLPLIKLQARSLNRYLDRSFIKQIIVVDNSPTTPIQPDELLPQYGSLPAQYGNNRPAAFCQSVWRRFSIHASSLQR